MPLSSRPARPRRFASRRSRRSAASWSASPGTCVATNRNDLPRREGTGPAFASRGLEEKGDRDQQQDKGSEANYDGATHGSSPSVIVAVSATGPAKGSRT